MQLVTKIRGVFFTVGFRLNSFVCIYVQDRVHRQILPNEMDKKEEKKKKTIKYTLLSANRKFA